MAYDTNTAKQTAQSFGNLNTAQSQYQGIGGISYSPDYGGGNTGTLGGLQPWSGGNYNTITLYVDKTDKAVKIVRALLPELVGIDKFFELVEKVKELL